MRRWLAVLTLAALGLGFVPAACLSLGEVQADPDSHDAGPSDSSAESPVADSGPGFELLGTTVPSRPSGPAEPSGKGSLRWFAARHVYTGSIDPETGAQDTSAWKKLGYDLDGECTTLDQSKGDSSGTCTKPPNAASDSLEDGDDCRDNRYGRLIAQVIENLNSSWEANFQAGIANGEATLLLRISDLDDGPSDAFAPGAIYLSAQRETAPHWDGTDDFQIQSVSVKGSSVVDPPIVSFPAGYVANDTWVSGELGTSPGPFPMYLVTEIAQINLLSRTLVVKLDATHETALGSSFAAVASRAAITADLWTFILPLFNCDAATAQGLVDLYVLPAADVGGAPPSFSSPGVECSGISVGGAFQWVPIAAPTEVVPSIPPSAPCDAG
jgi:hypothetical protein